MGEREQYASAATAELVHGGQARRLNARARPFSRRVYSPRGGCGDPPRTSRSGSAAAFALALAALTLAGCGGEPVEVVKARHAMDTEVTVRVVAPSEEVGGQWLALAWAEMDECINYLDAHRDDSHVARINKAAGRWHVEVHPLVTSCLAAAKEVCDETDGAFDPTVGPLLELWRKAAETNRLPTDDEIAKARALVGMDMLEMLVAAVQRPLGELDGAPPGAPPPTPDELPKMVHSVGIRKGMRLDLGGIAKGYIAGRMARRLEQAGAAAGLVAAGGDVYAFGVRPESLVPEGGDRRWGVGVQDPRSPDDRSRLYTAIRLKDQSVDTSGHTQRGFTVAGQRFSHIIDPRSGRPVDRRLASVTVVAENPALSDALATAVAVLGVTEGMALIEDLVDVECLLLEMAPAGASVEGDAETKGPPPLIAHRSSGFAAMEYDPNE